MSAFRWTEPFHGVMHLGESRNDRYRATVCEYGTFAELSKWFPGCAFSPHKETFDTAADARKAGENYLKSHTP